MKGRKSASAGESGYGLGVRIVCLAIAGVLILSLVVSAIYF